MDEHTAWDWITGTGGRLAVVVLLTLVVAVTAGGAAGSTTVRVTAEDSVAVSETTTVDVVVDDADHGVGALNVTVALANPTVANITDVELKGNPSEKTSLVRIAPDGSSVTMIAALMDTEETGAVTIASVTVRAEHAGTTDVNLTVSALGDERGHSYVTASKDTRLTVREDGATPNGGPDDGAPPNGDPDGESGEAAAPDPGLGSAASQVSRAIGGEVAPNGGQLAVLAGVALVVLVSLRRLL